MSLADAYQIEMDMIYDARQKRKNAADMMVPIMKIQLPDELLRTVSQFLFYDIRSNAYHEKRETQYYRSIMQYVVDKFNYCRRQNYSCRRLCCCDVEFEYNYMTKNIYFTICTQCGNYRHQRNLQIRCHCLLM
jgi:hypothetical protein